jgi:hypothetical protein
MQAFLTELLTANAWVVVAATMTTVNVVRNVFFIMPASSVSNLLGGVCSPFDEANMPESSASRCSRRHRSMKFLIVFAEGRVYRPLRGLDAPADTRPADACFQTFGRNCSACPAPHPASNTPLRTYPVQVAIAPRRDAGGNPRIAASCRTASDTEELRYPIVEQQHVDRVDRGNGDRAGCFCSRPHGGLLHGDAVSIVTPHQTRSFQAALTGPQ